MREAFFFNIYAIVNEIPSGFVASYQLLAQLSNHPKNSRLVGTALRCSSQYGDYPCHRVVHSDGSLVANWDEQKVLLIQEGVKFKDNGKVDMKACIWKIK